tara:strand:+ start:199 stop:1047 length:849 start_codon:yes stop_codon:yes gene_type:complete
MAAQVARTVTQSAGLRARHIQLHLDGKHLMMDANESEATLNDAMEVIKEQAKAKIEAIGGVMSFSKKCSLFSCQKAFHKHGGSAPNPEKKSVSMKPDGGIIWAQFGEYKDGEWVCMRKYPVFIGEDKVQGTNDSRLAEGKPRQATGNAIERAAKNIRGSEMICMGQNTFPYVLFASGCDFHDSETIADRLEMMNMGVPNHYFGVNKDTTPEQLNNRLVEIIQTIDIKKKCGIGIASIFVKAHKWDELPHGGSRWRKKEIVELSCTVIDQAIADIQQIEANLS